MSDRTLKVLITALAFFSLFYRLGMTELRAEEPRRAAVSIEMLENGNPMVPTLTGYPYYNKPPLFNWLQVLFYKITGETNERVSRLPGILSVILTAVFIYLALIRIQLKRIAFYAMIIFLSFADLLFYGTVNAGEIDLFFTLLIFLQVSTLYLGETEKKVHWFLISYTILGLAFLTKGFPAFWFQLTAALACWITGKSFSIAKVYMHFTGIFATGLVLALYYIPLNIETGMAECYIRNLITESGQRSAMGFEITSILKNAAVFPLNFLKLLLPWSFFFIYLLTGNRSKAWANPAIRTSILFVLFSVPVFWFTGEIRNRYLYPLFPFIAFVLAFVLELSRERLNSIKMIDLLFISIPALFAISCIVALVKIPELAHPQILIFIAGCVFIFLFLLSLKLRGYRLHLALFSIFGLRILYSATVLPASTLSKDEINSYQEQIKVLVKNANQEPISLDLPAQRIGKGNCSVFTAPILPYQYPYYYYQLTGKVLKQDISRNNSIVLKDEMLEEHFPDAYEFSDRQGNKYLLISDF